VKELVITKGLLTAAELQIILSPEEMTRPGIAGKQFLK